MDKVSGYFEEINETKYLTLVPTNEKYMKIKFNSDHEFNLNKMIQIPSVTIVVRAVFHKNIKIHPQVFLDECLYKL